jgi:GT2 family glycosyltransferase
MVSYGALALTSRALAALEASTDETYEVIVVDNGSDAHTRAALSEMAWLRLVLNSANRGFGPASNQGAALARGRYLLFLNTDAFLHPGWFPRLAHALDLRDVAAVVPKLLNADGSLQDAGVLLAQDGRVIVYGDGERPDDPRFDFRRYVDAGSAAVMLMHRERFLELGGFDDRYAPAYYEDADLCLRIAASGSRVLYEPSATATHVRHGSGSLEQARVLSERNRGRFAQRWATALTGRPRSFAAASPQAALTARDAGAWPRMLALSHPGGSARASAPDLGALVQRLLGHWPQARLSWAHAPAAGPVQLDPWVESLAITGPGWLDDRRFHYDAILLDGPAEPEVRAVLDRTQPQAARIELSELREVSDQRLLSTFARAGLLSAARARRGGAGATLGWTRGDAGATLGWTRGAEARVSPVNATEPHRTSCF